MFKTLAKTTLLLSFAAPVSPAGAKTLLDRVVVVVGDEPILFSEVQQLKERLEKSPTLASIYHIDPKRITFESVMNKMIDDKIVHFALKEIDAPVTDTEVDNQIASIAKQNNMTLTQLQDSLKREGIPFETYKNNIRAQFERRNVFERELRRGGGVTEAELRSIYDQKSKPEMNLSFIAGASVKSLKKVKEDILAQKMPIEEIEKKFPLEDLGWVNPENLDDNVAKLLNAAAPGDTVGPVKISGKQGLICVRARRKGSEDEFQKLRPELTQEAQNMDYEKRFTAWLERKKTEMHIVVNPA